MRDYIIYNLTHQLTYQSLFMKENHYSINDKVANNKFDLTMKGSISACSSSRKYDGHGVVLGSKNVIKDGVVKNIYGDIQFGYYLNQKNITGSYPVCELKAKGTSSYKKEKHLIIENFSAPQLDEDSGYFGGEVRLARYFDGKKYIPLTGFSIAGNIYKDFEKVEFSKEIDSSESYLGPKYMIFSGIEIS